MDSEPNFNSPYCSPRSLRENNRIQESDFRLAQHVPSISPGFGLLRKTKNSRVVDDSEESPINSAISEVSEKEEE